VQPEGSFQRPFHSALEGRATVHHTNSQHNAALLREAEAIRSEVRAQLRERLRELIGRALAGPIEIAPECRESFNALVAALTTLAYRHAA
jgi:hypothetical protein